MTPNSGPCETGGAIGGLGPGEVGVCDTESPMAKQVAQSATSSPATWSFATPIPGARKTGGAIDGLRPGEVVVCDTEIGGETASAPRQRRGSAAMASSSTPADRSHEKRAMCAVPAATARAHSSASSRLRTAAAKASASVPGA